jgi:hypothetical protein
MNNGDDPKNQGRRAGKNAPPAARPALRLIKDDSVEAPKTQLRPGLKNPLVKFMGAYADAIDREIQAILDL